MNNEQEASHSKLVWPFLAWNFGWTWGLCSCIILKSLAGKSPILYQALEGLLTSLSMFGPVMASLIVLKIKTSSHLFLYILSERNLAHISLLFSGSPGSDFALASEAKLVGRLCFSLLDPFIYPYGFGWQVAWRATWLARDFLQHTAFGKRVLYVYLLLDNRTQQTCWHIPLWFGSSAWSKSGSLSSLYHCKYIPESPIWFAALHKEDENLSPPVIFHALLDIW